MDVAKLLNAAADGDLEIVRKIIERGQAQVDAQGALNRTALHQAAMNGKLEVVLYLLERRANKNVIGNSGDTPLHLAVLNGHRNVVEALLDEGADFTLANSAGKRPVDIARKRDMRELLDNAAAGKLPKNAEAERKAEDEKKQRRDFMPDQSVIDMLAGVGYSKGQVLAAMHHLFEAKQEYNNLAVAMKYLTDEAKKASDQAGAPAAKPPAAAEDDNCKICFERAVDCVLLNCGHICVCMLCSAGLRHCPMCRQPFDRAVKVFKS